MRTLFLKIFFCFLVIIILVGTSLETSALLARFYEDRWQVTLHSIMPMEAEKAARMYEAEGPDKLRDYLDDLQSRKSVRFYFFDEEGEALLDRPAPPVVQAIRMAEQIERLVTAQRNLLGDVSHELRSPLARLIVALSLLKQGQGEEAFEYQSRIGIEAERLDKLIGQLLTLTRIDSGIDSNLRETFDLANLVQEVVADGDFEARAQNRSVRFLANESCAMTGVAELIRSAVENVIRNAVRHTAPGTAVEVTIERQSKSILLRVRDHGPGVTDAMLQDIFLPFHRAEAGTNGSGLGLAIADRVVRMHNGTIQAYNAREGGLVIDIQLPY